MRLSLSLSIVISTCGVIIDLDPKVSNMESKPWMSQITAIVINITLDGPNYLEWAFSVETALRGVGLLFHLMIHRLSSLMVVMLLQSKVGKSMMGK